MSGHRLQIKEDSVVSVTMLKAVDATQAWLVSHQNSCLPGTSKWVLRGSHKSSTWCLDKRKKGDLDTGIERRKPRGH